MTTVRGVLRITLPELPAGPRNALINRGWFKLSRELGDMLGRENANIATFAVWSSVTVGMSLRSAPTRPSRRRPQGQRGPLRRFAQRRVAPVLDRLPGSRWSSDAARTVAVGTFLRLRGWPTRVFGRSMTIANRGVFFEIGLALADFVETFGDPANRSPEGFDALAERVRQMPRPPGGDWLRPRDEQRELLVDGLRFYYDALAASGCRRSQLVLAGNVAIDAYEQARLDPWLDASLLSPWGSIRRFFQRFRLVGHPAPRWQDELLGPPPEPAGPLGRVARWCRYLVARMVTRLFVQLRLPNELLVVTRPLLPPLVVGPDGNPQPVRSSTLFPDDLATLDPDVQALYERYDPGGGDRTDGAGTGVRRWTEYDARMRYVACYLRSRQQDRSLWEAPYRPEHLQQIAELEQSLVDWNEPPAGRRPGPDPLDLRRQVGDHSWDGDVAAAFAATSETAVGVDQPDLRRVRDGLLADPAIRALINRPPLAPLLEPEIEAEILTRGRRFYSRHRLYLLSGLMLRALPDTYAAANGVRVLNLVSSLADDAQRRVPDTARMLEAVMAPGGLQPGSEGLDRTRIVRLMHAAARQLALSSRNVPASGWHPSLSEWDTIGWGFPVNQEDMVATILEFGVAPVTFMQRIGVPFRLSDADAYVRAWCLVGRELGVDDDLMTSEDGGLLGYHDGLELLERIRERQHATSWEGARMAAALLDQLELWTIPPLGAVPRAALRVAAPDGVPDLLGIPRRGVLEHLLAGFAATMRFPLLRPAAWLLYTLASPLGWVVRWVMLAQPSADAPPSAHGSGASNVVEIGSGEVESGPQPEGAVS